MTMNTIRGKSSPKLFKILKEIISNKTLTLKYTDDFKNTTVRQHPYLRNKNVDDNTCLIS